MEEVVASKQAEATTRLLKALENTPNAVIQVGALLVIKVDNSVMVRNLSSAEQNELMKNPDLLRDPRQIAATVREWPRSD